MRILTCSQMKQAEKNAWAGSLSYVQMMENAGAAAAQAIREKLPGQGARAVLFCGRGNNGGDGLVAARLLCQAGWGVSVVLTDGVPRTPDAQVMYEKLAGLPVEVVPYGEDPEWLARQLAQANLLVDAIYGTGFHGELDGRHRDICRLINGVDVLTCALDIPSGVTADTGWADPQAVQADFTVVFDSHKPATVMPRAARWCGQVLVREIGIPEEAHRGLESGYRLTDRAAVFSVLKKRVRESHKGSYGKLLVVAGSQRYMGAAMLATLAAMRTGAGYVTLASTKEVCRTVLPSLPEAVMLPLRQNPDGSISADSREEILQAAERSTAVLVGNGMGQGDDVCRIVYELVTHVRVPLVIDADGINALARNIDILKRGNCPVVLTPHRMELSRLTTLPVEELAQQDIQAGRRLAEEYGCTVVLKDAYTHTVTPKGEVWINTSGNAGLAKAGSGDLLAGMIGSLAAQGYPPEQAAACGVWLHGRAADYAAAQRSQFGMLPRDVLDGLTQLLAEEGY